MASYRYRTQIPAEHLNASINCREAEIVVFSKPAVEDVEFAEGLKGQGVVVVIDICDPLFRERPHYEEILKYADHAVVPTKTAGDLVSKYSDTTTTVIPDPYEFDEVEPHADGNRLLWFGHDLNLPDILPYMDMENLKIVSGPETREGSIKYTPEALLKAFSESNICLFPTRPGCEYKSPNRFLNAVRQGLFPVCHDHPSYEEFTGAAWIGEIETGIRWAKQESPFLNSLVSELQGQIRDRYSPGTVAGLWKDLLDSI